MSRNWEYLVEEIRTADAGGTAQIINKLAEDGSGTCRRKQTSPLFQTCQNTRFTARAGLEIRGAGSLERLCLLRCAPLLYALMPHITGTLALERPRIIVVVAATTDCWNVRRNQVPISRVPGTDTSYRRLAFQRFADYTAEWIPVTRLWFWFVRQES